MLFECLIKYQNIENWHIFQITQKTEYKTNIKCTFKKLVRIL